jgi:hypothetical protein
MIKLLQPLEEIGCIYAFNKEKTSWSLSFNSDAFRMQLPQDFMLVAMINGTNGVTTNSIVPLQQGM